MKPNIITIVLKKNDNDEPSAAVFLGNIKKIIPKNQLKKYFRMNKKKNQYNFILRIFS